MKQVLRTFFGAISLFFTTIHEGLTILRDWIGYAKERSDKEIERNRKVDAIEDKQLDKELRTKYANKIEL